LLANLGLDRAGLTAVWVGGHARTRSLRTIQI
jgi:hypothetical protein